MKMEILRPFGPAVLKFKMPEHLINALNSHADHVLKNEELIKKLDHSRNLAGRIRHEFLIEAEKLELCREWFSQTVREYVKNYLYDMADVAPLGINHVYIDIPSAWINCSYSGDYNPTHHHLGEASLVSTGFLKIPDWDEEHELQAKTGEGIVTSGHLTLSYGQPEKFGSHIFTIKPEVGDFYVWPAGLLHSVWPFKSPGERRSMAVNFEVELVQADITIKKKDSNPIQKLETAKSLPVN